MSLLDKIIHTITTKHKIILIAIILLTIPLGIFYGKQGFYNHVDIYFDKGDESLETYKKFQEEYGNDQQLLIVFKDRDIFTARNIDIIKKISNLAKDSKGVNRVFSITTIDEAVGKNNSVTFRKFFPEGAVTEKELKSARNRILENPKKVAHLISKDGTATAVIIEIEILDDITKRELIMMIRDEALKIAEGKVELHFAGVPYLETEANILSKKDVNELGVVILLIVFVLVSILLRNFIFSLVCLFSLVLISTWSVGVFVLFGQKFNLVSSILGSIILAISVSDAIHFLAKYRKESVFENNDALTAIKSTIKSVFIPCLLTSVTTAVGFLSFVTSPVKPIRTLGIFTAIGIIIAFVITFTFIPAVILIIYRKKKKESPVVKAESANFMGKFLQKNSDFVIKNYKFISAVFLILVVLIGYGIVNIKFVTNDIKLLKESNQLRQDFDFIEENLWGTLPYTILIEAKSEENDFTNPESLKLVDEINTFLADNIYEMSAPYNVVDYFKTMNQAFKGGDKKYFAVPETREDVLEFYELGDVDIFDRLMSPDKKVVRLTSQARACSNERALEVRAYLNKVLPEKLQGKFTHTITGLTDVYIKMETNLQTSQIRSLLVAFVFIFLVMFFICRNFSLTLLTMVPNLFPIAMVLGLMGWTGIPFDYATIMIASVTMGIAVDDTIHFTVHYRNNSRAGLSIIDAVKKTYEDVGRQIINTTIVLCIGFLALVFGNIKPTIAFGALTSLAMIFALIGDLLILPALILIFKPEIK